MVLPAAPVGPARRPSVLDASQVALIPLRPLTIGEILDAGFLILRRDARTMLGVPLAVSGATVLYVFAISALWSLLGNLTGTAARTVLIVLGALLGVLLLSVCLSWMTAVLSRVGLQAALGPGYAPDATMDWRRARSLFWPMLGLSILQGLAGYAVQWVVTIVWYAGLLGTFAATGVTTSPTMAVVSATVWSLVALLVYGAAYSYLFVVVPAWSLEGESMPAWIGKPAKPTNVVSAFGRAIVLVGWRDLLRASLVVVATTVLSLITALAVWVGLALVLWLYGDVVGVDLTGYLRRPVVLVVSYVLVLVVTVSAALSYTASVQSVLYLDLRMRREGLDLALRFDAIDPPQPSAPPPPLWVPAPYAYPPPPPVHPPAQSEPPPGRHA